eukprot:TRINITY_DN14162_c0_g1_i1.p1 TRINITY_DN14162_c0_g1~~TRINITY_DN14162_c0_g1_i1.p1  ORF type:complete len:281 (+),score=38.36 TRINITY_DN14162_c0_g1_i1:122-964(+)
MAANSTATHGPLDGLLSFYEQKFSFHEDELTWRYGIGLHILPWTASVLYVAMVYWLPGYLIRNKINLSAQIKPIMAAWNLFLSVLSGAMFLGLLFPAIYMMQEKGVWNVVCNPYFTTIPNEGTYVLWAAIFGWMKYAELLDTVFMIIKNPKREIPFLHWYHHFTVLIFTWYAANWNLSIGWEFAIVNSLVHTFMYWYYFQMERGIRPWWAKPLTVGQIAQMVFGLFLNCIWFYGYKNGLHCSCTQPEVLIAMGSTIYFSYLVLFSKYFVERYWLKKVKSE